MGSIPVYYAHPIPDNILAGSHTVEHNCIIHACFGSKIVFDVFVLRFILQPIRASVKVVIYSFFLSFPDQCLLLDTLRFSFSGGTTLKSSDLNIEVPGVVADGYIIESIRFAFICVIGFLTTIVV